MPAAAGIETAVAAGVVVPGATIVVGGMTMVPVMVARGGVDIGGNERVRTARFPPDRFARIPERNPDAETGRNSNAKDNNHQRKRVHE
jgi:hypothetical protein